jgi:hypothetical protein
MNNLSLILLQISLPGPGVYSFAFVLEVARQNADLSEA